TMLSTRTNCDATSTADPTRVGDLDGKLHTSSLGRSNPLVRTGMQLTQQIPQGWETSMGSCTPAPSEDQIPWYELECNFHSRSHNCEEPRIEATHKLP